MINFAVFSAFDQFCTRLFSIVILSGQNCYKLSLSTSIAWRPNPQPARARGHQTLGCAACELGWGPHDGKKTQGMGIHFRLKL